MEYIGEQVRKQTFLSKIVVNFVMFAFIGRHPSEFSTKEKNLKHNKVSIFVRS